MRLDDAHGFVFDLDGTLVRRAPGGAIPIPGAREVVAAIRASGRPLVVFTNASHATPARIAAGVRKGGLDIGDDEVLTPICSALSHLGRRHPGARVLAIGTEDTRSRMAGAGVALVSDAEAARADVVLVAHVDQFDVEVLEGAAHAILAGATFLTTNYVRAYAGVDGPILSRGAMAAAAIAKAAARRPTVVGKPSRAAVREVADRLGVGSRDAAVIGDDVHMDIALGHLGGSRTVLVRTGISHGELNGVREDRLPHLVVDSVADVLGLL